MAGRRLIGEIGIDDQMFTEIKDAVLVDLRRGYGVQRFAASSPYLFVSYLVGHGVYCYKAGDFWGSTIRGIDGTAGQLFERTVRKLGIETFEDMVHGEGALRYVGPILAHGGVPEYCLGDFFALLVRDAHKVEDDATDLLAYWRTRKTSFFGIDTPVRRFLLYGGDVSVDFLDRCLDLLREYRQKRHPTAEEIGLPPYVVHAFERFVTETPPPSAAVGTRTRLARPTVRFDPWSPSGPELELPPVPADLVGAFWRVQADGSLHRVDALRHEAQRVPLQPARSWIVELHDGATVRRQTSFEGLDEDSALALFFDPDNGSLMPIASGLQAESVWVLQPPDATVSGIDSEGSPIIPRVLEELPPPTGDWSGFEARHLVIDGFRSVNIRSATAGRDRRIVVRAPSARPRLGSAPLAGVTSEQGLPVFSVVPELVLPHDSATANWTIRVGSSDGWQTINPTQLSVGDEGLLLSRFVNPNEIAEVDLVVSGPLGSDLRASFVVVPDLEVRRPERPLLPSDGDAHVAVHSNAVAVDDGRIGEPRSIPLPRGRGQVDVRVSDERGLQYPLRISVARLLWGERDRAGQATSLVDEPLTWPADSILSGDIAALAVSTGAADVPLRLELRADPRVLRQTETVSTGREGRWLFDLATFKDDVRTSDAPRLEVLLHIGVRTVPLARIRPSFDVEQIQMTSRVVGDFTSVDVRFDERRPLRGSRRTSVVTGSTVGATDRRGDPR